MFSLRARFHHTLIRPPAVSTALNVASPFPFNDPTEPDGRPRAWWTGLPLKITGDGEENAESVNVNWALNFMEVTPPAGSASQLNSSFARSLERSNGSLAGRTLVTATGAKAWEQLGVRAEKWDVARAKARPLPDPKESALNAVPEGGYFHPPQWVSPFPGASPERATLAKETFNEVLLRTRDYLHRGAQQLWVRDGVVGTTNVRVVSDAPEYDLIMSRLLGAPKGYVADAQIAAEPRPEDDPESFESLFSEYRRHKNARAPEKRGFKEIRDWPFAIEVYIASGYNGKSLTKAGFKDEAKSKVLVDYNTPTILLLNQPSVAAITSAIEDLVVHLAQRDKYTLTEKEVIVPPAPLPPGAPAPAVPPQPTKKKETEVAWTSSDVAAVSGTIIRSDKTGENVLILGAHTTAELSHFTTGLPIATGTILISSAGATPIFSGVVLPGAKPLPTTDSIIHSGSLVTSSLSSSSPLSISKTFILTDPHPALPAVCSLSPDHARAHYVTSQPPFSLHSLSLLSSHLFSLPVYLLRRDILSLSASFLLSNQPIELSPVTILKTNKVKIQKINEKDPSEDDKKKYIKEFNEKYNKAIEKFKA